jgi:hypothetical protein
MIPAIPRSKPTRELLYSPSGVRLFRLIVASETPGVCADGNSPFGSTTRRIPGSNSRAAIVIFRAAGEKSCGNSRTSALGGKNHQPSSRIALCGEAKSECARENHRL